MPMTKHSGIVTAYTTITFHILLKTRREKFREREFMKNHRVTRRIKHGNILKAQKIYQSRKQQFVR